MSSLNQRWSKRDSLLVSVAIILIVVIGLILRTHEILSKNNARFWTFNDIVTLCEKPDVPDSVLTWLAAVKLPNEELCPTNFSKEGVFDDGAWEKCQKFDKKYLPSYKKGVTRSERVTKEYITLTPGKILEIGVPGKIRERAASDQNIGYLGSSEPRLCYDITATPGFRYIQVNKVTFYADSSDTTDMWFIRWSGK